MRMKQKFVYLVSQKQAKIKRLIRWQFAIFLNYNFSFILRTGDNSGCYYTKCCQVCSRL
jgi:hypothetical protein